MTNRGYVKVLCIIFATFLSSRKFEVISYYEVCHLPRQTNPNKLKTPAVGGWGRGDIRPSTNASTLHLLLRGQGVREVLGVRGVREVQVVQECHLGQGGQRVPAAGEGGPGERRPGATPTSSPNSWERAPLTLGPRGPVSPLGPYGVGAEETREAGLEKENREESWAGWRKSRAEDYLDSSGFLVRG